MKGNSNNRRSKTLLVSFLALLFSFAVQASGNEKSLIVITSSDNQYFTQTIEALSDLNDSSLELQVIGADKVQEKRESLNQSDFIVTLGAKATKTVLSEFPDKPTFSAYLTQQQLQQLGETSSRHTSVLLEQPLARYLAFSQALLMPKSIGLVNFDPLAINPAQTRLLRQLTLDLNQYHPRDKNQILNRVRQAVQENDVLLMLPDSRLINRQSLKGILLTTYRAKKPVISYSPAHVKSGALGSIYSSPKNIGQHLGELINEHLHDSIKTRNQIQFARYYSIETNSRVAHTFSLVLPDDATLRTRIDEAVK